MEHHCRYDSDWLSIALFNSDHEHAEAAAREVEAKRIALQIMPNGSEWIELERNVPSGYCQYNLEALSTCADLSTTLATHSGDSSIWEFSTEDGRSLRKSIDWLLQYATNETVWPYESPHCRHSSLRLTIVMHGAPHAGRCSVADWWSRCVLAM